LRFLALFVMMAVIALGTGFGLSYFALTDGRFFGAYTWGPWTTWPNAGAPDPDPYTRAMIARNAALPLGRGEGVVFTARTDEAGETLDLACQYTLSGPTPIAAFWTLRAVHPDTSNAAPANAQQTMRSDRLVRDNDGIATIQIGTAVAPGNWLELEGDGQFELVLTLYDASVFAGLGTTVEALPVITRERCS